MQFVNMQLLRLPNLNLLFQSLAYRQYAHPWRNRNSLGYLATLRIGPVLSVLPPCLQIKVDMAIPDQDKAPFLEMVEMKAVNVLLGRMTAWP